MRDELYFWIWDGENWFVASPDHTSRENADEHWWWVIGYDGPLWGSDTRDWRVVEEVRYPITSPREV